MTRTVVALEFPPISHFLEWPDLALKNTPFAINKTTILFVVSLVLTLGFFFLAGRKAKLVPTGVQNAAEASVDFIREGIILQTIGPDGMRYLPFLTAVFFYILFINIFEVIPFVQFPANARFAVPVLLALLVWVIFNVVGVAKQGLFGYLKSNLFPPGVPKPVYLLVTPIEFVSTFLVRPLSLSVRLFANMLAGHLILVTFAILTAALWSKTLLIVIWPFTFGLLIGLTAFEILVSFLQAFIFTILTAVYIGGAMHPEH